MALDLEKYNDQVKAWGQKARGRMILTGKTKNISHRSNSPNSGDSLNKIRDRYRSTGGQITIVQFSNINRSLIMSSQGAGKGIGGDKGSSWLDKYGKRQSTNPSSLGKIGSGTRQIKNFIGETLDGPEGIPELSDIAALALGDAIIDPKDAGLTQLKIIK